MKNGNIEKCMTINRLQSNKKCHKSLANKLLVKHNRVQSDVEVDKVIGLRNHVGSLNIK